MASTPEPSPALGPPSGQMSDFDQVNTLLKWDIVCVTACLAVTTLIFVLRTWVRVVVKKQWILKDCASILGCYITIDQRLIVMCCISYVRGLGSQVYRAIPFSILRTWSLASSRTAKLSTGIICTCLPTLPTLIRRRHTNSPSTTAVNRTSKSRRAKMISVKQHPSLTGQEPFNREYSELGEGNFHGVGLEPFPKAVITGIEGGTTRYAPEERWTKDGREGILREVVL